MSDAPADGCRAALGQDFFARPTLTVARDLIGTVLRVESSNGTAVSGRIVETEAYLGQDDPASHAGGGLTPRSAIMFGAPGYLYVYLIYGLHHCLNLVTEAEGTAGAVLIRAIEPIAGLETMARRRTVDLTDASIRLLCAGPGRLSQACGVDLSWNGLPVAANLRIHVAAPGRLAVFPAPENIGSVVATPRIGIRRGADAPFRFIAAQSGFLSR